jgi:hypothetical protein
MNKMIIAKLLTLLSIWITTLPLFFILLVMPGNEIEAQFQKTGCILPTGSVFVVHHTTATNMAIITLLFCVILLAIQWQIRTEQHRLVLQIAFIVLWQLAVLGILCCRTLPFFKMGDVVRGESTTETSQQTSAGDVANRAAPAK